MNIKANVCTIDYDAITFNAKIISEKTNKKVFAVIKNNAYNFGMEKTVISLTKGNVSDFAVTTMEEALKVRMLNSSCQVLQFNPATDEEISLAKQHNISLAIGNYSWFLEHYNALDGITLHLKINVGMNRFGLNDLTEIKNVITLCKENNLKLCGLITHFPLAEENDLTEHSIQVERFVEIYDKIKPLHEFRFIHSENTAAILQFDNRLSFCTHVRPGIMVYGYSPVQKVDFLKPSLYLKSKVTDIHEIKKGSHLGYGTGFTAPNDMKIAVLAIGYGDGLIRRRKAKPVYINNNFYNCISNIFMSHTFVEVDEDVKIGDFAEIYGKNIPMDELSHMGLFPCSEQSSALHIKDMYVPFKEYFEGCL